MKSARHRFVLAFGLVMALAMAALGGDPRTTAAQGGGSVAIYSYACPAGFDGGDY